VAQVLKAEVRTRIEDAALRLFADRGYDGTSMAQVAAAAGTAPANVYRYHASKQALFDAVVPPALPARHDTLLDTRVAALAAGTDDGTQAGELLDFWLAHRLAVVVLLDQAEGTPYAGYPAAFVQRLVDHVLRNVGTPPTDASREVVRLVFDNTRRAIAAILRSTSDDAHARELIRGFWSYQLPGLDGLMAYLRNGGAAG
jgi:AcrR family transcriptional regulator